MENVNFLKIMKAFVSFPCKIKIYATFFQGLQFQMD